jgi:hypothetical protein
MTDRLKVERFIQELTRAGEAKISYDVGRFLQDAFGKRVLPAIGHDGEGHPAVTMAALSRVFGTQPVFVLQALHRALNGVNYNPWRRPRSPFDLT